MTDIELPTAEWSRCDTRTHDIADAWSRAAECLRTRRDPVRVAEAFLATAMTCLTAGLAPAEAARVARAGAVALLDRSADLLTGEGGRG